MLYFKLFIQTFEVFPPFFLIMVFVILFYLLMTSLGSPGFIFLKIKVMLTLCFLILNHMYIVSSIPRSKPFILTGEVNFKNCINISLKMALSIALPVLIHMNRMVFLNEKLDISLTPV